MEDVKCDIFLWPTMNSGGGPHFRACCWCQRSRGFVMVARRETPRSYNTIHSNLMSVTTVRLSDAPMLVVRSVNEVAGLA
jgi:hypothetical protein